ncbi:uncharacterized protein SPPG_01599 [Spizellomyces punctatus DAOM BR117]|uniref:Uncharacterized protein n=1 Tax=Spizellomyces punctatus (strain DAOM BR117) TaxID=645134 RepID=A0A0L0HTE2_SPIPD|nr:uncharacterized protein SPPG_01599 [Spizellomyces punctatus DAOM BR117]KND04165.1 hypothetical protein SPPG_01599 [Spizellomyces punctatus DAOM BR117]|eukprot:XP_016612204.1 hypothetical protein SPPG_01599 [Spizellomyces punctatus DAOM BR117]
MPQPKTHSKPPPPKKKKPPKQPANNQHKRSSTSKLQEQEADPDTNLLITIQTDLLKTNPEQAVVNLIQSALNTHTTDPSFQTHLRTIKQLFYNRQYTDIFTNPALLPVYAAEYIPGRALCYRRLFVETKVLRDVLCAQDALVHCLGAGNGSEVVGIASAMVGLQEWIKCKNEASYEPRVTVHCQDLSNYGTVLPCLEAAIREAYQLPSSYLTIESSTSNLLDASAPLPPATLTTALFVLNELLATSKRGFVAFISRLVQSIPQGGLLLVVDSAGSFSECTVGKGEYMVYHLLDAVKEFEVLIKEDAVWYRCDPGLVYPLRLNHMRYFLRVYRRR